MWEKRLVQGPRGGWHFRMGDRHSSLGIFQSPLHCPFPQSFQLCSAQGTPCRGSVGGSTRKGLDTRPSPRAAPGWLHSQRRLQVPWSWALTVSLQGLLTVCRSPSCEPPGLGALTNQQCPLCWHLVPPALPIPLSPSLQSIFLTSSQCECHLSSSGS